MIAWVHQQAPVAYWFLGGSHQLAQIGPLKHIMGPIRYVGRVSRGNYYSKRHEDGVQNAWAGHLVYGWIPAQCIAKAFSIHHLRQLCRERNIKEGNCPVLSLCVCMAKAYKEIFWSSTLTCCYNPLQLQQRASK